MSVYTIPATNIVSEDSCLIWDKQWSNVPIIIDNGSYNCRVGLACHDKPALVFKNVVVRPRGQRRGTPLVGNDILDLEAVRHQLRTQFDRNLVTQLDVQEQVFDHIFCKLGMQSDGLDCPVVINEPPCNPLPCRAQMSELLFENYRAASICYYVDAMGALLEHSTEIPSNSLIVSFGYHTTHVLPVVGGKLDAANGMRINVGGAYLDFYMQRLLQLRYTHLVPEINLSRSEHLVHRFCHFALDYPSEVQNVDEVSVRITQSTTAMQRKNSSVAVDPVGANEALRRRREERLRLALDRRSRLLEVSRAARNGLRSDADPVLQKSLRALGLPDYLTALTRLEAVQSTIERLNEQRDEHIPEVLILGGPRFSLVNTPDIRLDNDLSQEKRQQLNEWLQVVRLRGVRDQRTRERARRLAVTESLQSASELEQRRARLLERRSVRRAKRQSEAERRQRVSLLKGTLGPEAILNSDANLAEDGGDSSESEAEAEELAVLERRLHAANERMFFSPEMVQQMTLRCEVVRVPELLFRPSLMGIEQAGLGEALGMVLSRYPQHVVSQLASSVLVTGATAALPGCVDRIALELRQQLPMDTPLDVQCVVQPSLAAWRGARLLSARSDFQQRCITRSQYDECGHDYLQEHDLSNSYVLPLK